MNPVSEDPGTVHWVTRTHGSRDLKETRKRLRQADSAKGRLAGP